MTTTPTSDVNATLQRIAELTASGCQVVRPALAQREVERIGAHAGLVPVPAHPPIRGMR